MKTNVEFLKDFLSNYSHLGVNAWTLFQENIESYRGCNIIDIIEDEEPEDYIVIAFMWDGTHEGFKFWADIDDDWIKYCEVNNLEIVVS